MKEDKRWHVLYTKPRWEKKVHAALERKFIESWCPVQRIQKQWSDRKKIIEDPLFKSYVFVHIDKTEEQKTMMTDGVLNFVYYVGKPAIVSDKEVELIKKYLAETEAAITLSSLEGFKQKDKVKITHGVFMDNEGVVLQSGKKKLYVELKTLDQVMVVEFPVTHLQKI